MSLMVIVSACPLRDGMFLALLRSGSSDGPHPVSGQSVMSFRAVGHFTEIFPDATGTLGWFLGSFASPTALKVIALRTNRSKSAVVRRRFMDRSPPTA